MDFNVILGILLFILVVYLIFKFVKKIVFAVISVFILIVLIIAGIGGMAYFDFKSLSTQENFDVSVVYAQEESLLYGVQIPFENSNPLIENISGITNIKTLDVNSIDKDSGEFVIVIDDILFKEIIKGKTFMFNDVLPKDQFEDYNLTFSDDDVLRIMDSKTPDDELLNIIFERANIPSFLLESARPIAQGVLSQILEEKKLTTKEVIFALVLSKITQDKESVLPLISGFKEDKIKVYPQRITFDLIKYIPTSVIEDNLE